LLGQHHAEERQTQHTNDFQKTLRNGGNPPTPLMAST
jgi:hypothetical protein